MLQGCDLSEPYTAPGFPFLPGFAAAPEGSPVLLDNSAWWRGLDDPVLDALIARALTQNLDLEIARERVIAARASRAGVPGAVALSSNAQAGVDGSVSTEGRSDPEGSATAAAGFDWVLDPYGARAGELRAANARVDIADAEVDAARLLLLYSLGNAYVGLRHDQRLLSLSRSELRARNETLALTRQLADADAATRLEVTRARARVAELEAALPRQEAAVTAGINEISVLTGAAPGTLPGPLAEALTAGGRQPRPSMSPEVGIPSDLLRNRPDIRIAERQYYAAIAAIGVARADRYPRLSLSGTITVSALSGAAGAEYFLGPVLAFPGLPDGPARAAVELRHSEARQAHTIWVNTVLTALLEVENALARYEATTRAMGSAASAARLYGEARDLTRTVFERGEATLGDLIDAEQAVAAADRTLAELRLQQARDFIELNVRLGAGHSAESRPATVSPELDEQDSAG